MENIIELKNVSFKYDEAQVQKDAALKNINLSFSKGGFTVILGHNGSGKSTLAKLLNGLLKPTEGNVIVFGMNTKDEKHEFSVKQKVGMVFQNPDNQIIATIVEEDVAFGPENLGFPREEIIRRVDGALKVVDMYEFRNKQPHKLSGGQKQRVAIAGVIAMRPECIVFDESTAMLDPKGRKEVMDTMLQLNRQGISIIFITHFMEEAQYADRTIIMDQGEIAADGTPKEVFSQPQELKKLGLSLPQTTELLFELREKIEIDTGCISVDDCVGAIERIIQK